MRKPHPNDFPPNYDKFLEEHENKLKEDRKGYLIKIIFCSIMIYFFWKKDNKMSLITALSEFLGMPVLDEYNFVIYWFLLVIFMLIMLISIALFYDSFKSYHKNFAMKSAEWESQNEYKKALAEYNRFEDDYDRETARMIRRKRGLNEIDNETAINAYAQLSMMQNHNNHQLFALVEKTVKSAKNKEYKSLEDGLNEIERLLGK